MACNSKQHEDGSGRSIRSAEQRKDGGRQGRRRNLAQVSIFRWAAKLQAAKRLQLVRSWGHQGSGSATNQLGQMESTAAGCNNFCSVAVEPSGFRLFVTFLVLTEADANRHHTSLQPAVALLNLRFQRGETQNPAVVPLSPIPWCLSYAACSSSGKTERVWPKPR